MCYCPLLVTAFFNATPQRYSQSLWNSRLQRFRLAETADATLSGNVGINPNMTLLIHDKCAHP